MASRSFGAAAGGGEMTECQRWRAQRTSWAPSNPINPAKYAVKLIPKSAAAAFVIAHHYAASMPATRCSVGLYEAGRAWLGLEELVGVAVFSVPMQPKVIPRYAPTLEPHEGVELGRFVLLDDVPANAESWFLARAFRVLRDALPEVRAVVSYSDPVARLSEDGGLIMPGHVGVIYQAFNAVYFGRGSGRTLELTPDGRVLSQRTLCKIRGSERGAAGGVEQLVAAGCPPMGCGETGKAYLERVLPALPKIRHPGNHVYGWALERRLELAAAAPYPKKDLGQGVIEGAAGR